ncbi:MAG: type II toxin-antitoxin system HicA family toxin [Nitrospinae bacterium]|nr:type II toxin-antitoxin system HicA family toxin [Nitrospinota bacterium]
MKPIPYREVRRKLIAAGFAERGTHGSHVKFYKKTTEGTLTVIVPKHSSEVPPGTIRSLLRQAMISENIFMDL